jgi:hypothetical protein
MTSTVKPSVYERRNMPMEDRFFLHVNKAGPLIPGMSSACWVWTGSRGSKAFPYGHFGMGSRTDGTRRVERSHRVSWFLAHGQWPSQFILHKCDNPPCVNPEHLFEGDNLANMADMISKGRKRTAQGTSHWKHVLTDADVIVIRRRLAAGETPEQLAPHFGVQSPAIRKILTRRTWRHIPSATEECR